MEKDGGFMASSSDAHEVDTASTRSLAGSHFGPQESGLTASGDDDAILDVSIGEYDRKATREGSLFQDLHVEYKVISTSHDTASGSARKQTEWHRYRDFELLRDFLVVSYPFVAVPPIAEKKVNLSWEAMGYDPFETAFLEERMNALEVFLERLVLHPVLKDERILHLFLRGGCNFREEVMATKFQEKADSRMRAVAASFRLKKSDRRFVETKLYADNLEISVQTILQNHRALVERERNTYKLHSVYGRILSEWSGIEADLSNELQMCGGHIDSLADSVDGFLEEGDLKFTQPMKEYSLYSDGLRSVVRHQLVLQYDLEQTEESLSAKAVTKANVMQEGEDQLSFGKLAARLLSRSSSKEGRLQSIQQEIDTLEDLSQEQLEKLNAFTRKSVTDLKRFHHQKNADIRAYWLAHAKLQIKFFEKALTTWENVQATFKNP